MEKEEPTEMDVVWLNIIIELFTRQKSTLQELHGKITALIEELKDLEQEISDTEEIEDEILETSSLISRFINLTLSDKKSTQPPSPTIPEYTATASHPSVEY